MNGALKQAVAGRRDKRVETELVLQLEHGRGTVQNVSASGIYCVTDAALSEGAPVKFSLQFQNFPGGPIQVNCIARIVRVEARGQNKGVAASIESFMFHRLPKSTLERKA